MRVVFMDARSDVHFTKGGRWLHVASTNRSRSTPQLHFKPSPTISGQGQVAKQPPRESTKLLAKRRTPGTMDGSSAPLHTRAIRLGLDVANGRHPLSRFVPAALLLFDAVLCALVIWKVPCKPPAHPISPLPLGLLRGTGNTADFCHTRHRDRLGGLHGAGQALPRRRARLHAHRGRHRAARVPRRARLHLHGALPRHGPGDQRPRRAVHIRGHVPGDARPRHGMLQEGGRKQHPPLRFISRAN